MSIAQHLAMYCDGTQHAPKAQLEYHNPCYKHSAYAKCLSPTFVGATWLLLVDGILDFNFWTTCVARVIRRPLPPPTRLLNIPTPVAIQRRQDTQAHYKAELFSHFSVCMRYCVVLIDAAASLVCAPYYVTRSWRVDFDPLKSYRCKTIPL